MRRIRLADVLYETPTMAITWALSVLGLLVALVPTFLLFKRDMNPAKFMAALEKLIHAGQFARARKLCRAVVSPIGHIATEALALRLEATVLRADDEADYRSAPETVPFEQRVREALEPNVQAELETVQRLAVAAGAGGAMAVASLWPPWPPLATGVGVAGALLALWALRMHASIRSGLELSLERLPQLVLPDDEMHLEDRVEPKLNRGNDTIAFSVKGPDGVSRDVRFDHEIIKIGRLSSAQLVLDHPDVSRLHAVIEVTPHGAEIIDLGSDAGTYINGSKVNKEPLATGDKIYIGPFVLTVL